MLKNSKPLVIPLVKIDLIPWSWRWRAFARTWNRA